MPINTDEPAGGEWFAALLFNDAALKAAMIDAMMMVGTIDPDRVCKWLRMTYREAIKTAGPENVAATMIERVRTALFGKDDARLPAKRLQVRRAQQRRNRARAARGY